MYFFFNYCDRAKITERKKRDHVQVYGWMQNVSISMDSASVTVEQ